MFIYALDINIASEKLDDGHTGWVKIDENGNLKIQDFNISNLADEIAQNVDNGIKVALGFEAPMWYPVPQREDTGKFTMKPRFDAENIKVGISNNKQWYQIGSQATVKSYVLGFLLFEWLVKKYQQTTRMTTCYDSWVKGDANIYLYEGFVTGNYKPKKDDYDNIKTNSKLSNDEVIDAYIVAAAFQQFNSNQPNNTTSMNLVFPKGYNFTCKTHLRVCSKEMITEETTTKSSHTDTISDLISSPDEEKYIASKCLSVWKHIIQDVNEKGTPKIILSGQKACDVYGFRLR